MKIMIKYFSLEIFKFNSALTFNNPKEIIAKRKGITDIVYLCSTTAVIHPRIINGITHQESTNKRFLNLGFLNILSNPKIKSEKYRSIPNINIITKGVKS